MADHLTEQRAETLVKNRKRRVWKRIVSALGCLVVFCTVYALVLPAITASEKTFCGEEEHKHTDACYERVLTCGLEERERSVTPGHVHGDRCYQEERNLVCALEESEDLLDENGEVLEPGHFHGSECYQVNKLMVCGLRESDDQVIEGHAHGDACYERRMVCGKEEHQHEEKCFINKKADVEAQADWEATLPTGSELNGVWAQDVLAVADSQLGYTESKQNYEIDEGAGYNRGWTRYGAWYGNAYGDWCAMFISFCLHYAGVDKEFMPRDANCQNWINVLKSEDWGLWRPADENGQAWTPAWVVEKQEKAAAEAEAAEEKAEGGKQSDGESKEEEMKEPAKAQEYAPRSGDLVFFNWDNNEDSDHVGIVYEVIEATQTEPAKLKTIEGNSSDCVQYVTYELADPSIMGYAQLPENPDAVEKKEEDSLSAEDRAKVDAVIEMIDALPTSEEVEEKLLAYEEDEDWTGYEEYLTAVSQQCWEAHYAYEDLGEDLQPYVTNHDKLAALEWLYTATNYAVAATKPAKDNSSQLTVLPSADTDELIEVNLYDYGNNVNEKWRGNENYPGFQQDFGRTNFWTNVDVWNPYYFNYGNNITTDLRASKLLDGGQPEVSNKGGLINSDNGDSDTGANSPISGALSSTLVNGYPQIEKDSLSLEYLFSDNVYAEKMNTENINGLFQYNEETGGYSFNSRENHAQFNKGSNTFTLYDQCISSNFIMYPFGNFLPFNDIVHDTKQSSQIDRNYLISIASSAQQKYEQDRGQEYGDLANALYHNDGENLWYSDFIRRMDYTYSSTDWGAEELVNTYFKVNGIPKTFIEDDPILQDVYTIDFDEPTNFFFGMEMKMSFMQPKDGLTGKSGRDPMVFYFTGDDDVWVYLDGTLFLDLSGIHRHVGGEIDFQKGEVRYYSLDVSIGDVGNTPYKTVQFKDILGEKAAKELLNSEGTFKDYSTHAFNFYYMERGAGSGVCRMNFNFPLMKRDSISVSKEVSTDTGDEGMLGNPDYRFQVLRANGEGKTDQLFIAAGTKYTIYGKDDKVVGTGEVDANGVFTLKAGQRAEFADIKEDAGKYYVRELLTGDEHGQYGTITVSGKSTTTVNNVTVGTDTFVGVDSPIKDMSDGTSVFLFDNKVTFAKLGALEISKTLVDFKGQAVTGESFDFMVTLDGVELPVGTSYKVGEQTKTVQTEGIVSVPAGSTALVSDIIAGTEFEVVETSASAEGYTVKYSGSEGVIVSGSSAKGTILTSKEAAQAVEVSVINSESGADVAIPVEKSILNPDGKEHAFRFDLVQVTDATGATPVDGAETMSVDLAVTDTATLGSAFVLSYREKDIDELPTKLYYKVSEQIDEAQKGAVDFDETFYVVEVTLSKDGRSFKADVTNAWKNGADKVADFAAASFSNVLLRDLTIQKKLVVPDGLDTSKLTFDFTVALSGDQVAQNASYKATKVKADGTREELPEPIEFVDGRATVRLRGGETLIIHGVPHGSTWSAVEAEADGYSVKHQIMPVEETRVVAGADTGAQVLTDSATGVVFTNTGGYKLPESGGFGTALHAICGVLAMLGAVVLFVIKRRNDREFMALSGK